MKSCLRPFTHLPSLIHPIFLVFLFVVFALPAGAKDPVDYVNPWLGGIGHLLTATTPDVQLPRGMVRLYPRTTPGIRDNYLADKIYGYTMGSMSNDFSVTGPCLTATNGRPKEDPARNASLFDHESEVATPYYYKVLQEENDIMAEYTVTAHSAFYRFAWPEKSEPSLLLSVFQDAELKFLDDKTIFGSQHTGRSAASARILYFYAEFSQPCNSCGGWTPKEVTPGIKEISGNGAGLYLTFSLPRPEPVLVRIGYSFISKEQAKENMQREIAGRDFDRVKAASREVWSKALQKIRIQGGTESQRTQFYTALYRVYGRKTTNISEYGNYYSGFDNKVHPTDGYDFYQMGESWGSFRSLYPLGLILEPERQNDIVRSYLRMYDQTGWLGDAAHAQRVMIGRHETGTITDAWFKGFRGYDVEKAWSGMLKNAMEATMIPWQNGKATSLDSVYYEKGFFPALPLGKQELVPEAAGFEKRQAVSVTLEHAYDDWCLARMAKELDKKSHFEYFSNRANNYRNVWDGRIGFMAPKTADGEWVFHDRPLDPIWSGGQGGRDYYTETNAWTYTFHVQHDIPGLIGLMGGKEKFTAKLDALFQEQFGGKGLKFVYLNQFPDGTGLIGQYNHGNQPGYHIPWLYNYAGEPWKTQRRVREILNVWYNDGPLGICGDEDEGEMSSWYIFGTLGFYPVCPGDPRYAISGPLFEEASVTVGNGRVFTIKAGNVSSANKYIQSARLNGKPFNTPFLTHDELVAGGTLEFKMGPRPNKEWGKN